MLEFPMQEAAAITHHSNWTLFRRLGLVVFTAFSGREKIWTMFSVAPFLSGLFLVNLSAGLR